MTSIDFKKMENSPAPLLRAENLFKAYKEAKGGASEVLRGAQFSLYPGESASLVGVSGSGKSTLLYCLGLLENLDSGTLFFKGKAVNGLSAQKKAEFRLKNLGFIFQFHHLIPELTALENVFLPCEIAGREDLKSEAAGLLKKVGLEGKEKRFPWQLSGGEQQRVAVARALANRPPLLLTDEATGNLDPKRAHEILDLLLSMCSELGTTLLSVTHDDSSARRYKRRFGLQEGQIWDLS